MAPMYRRMRFHTHFECNVLAICESSFVRKRSAPVASFPLHHEGPRVFPFHILTPTHTSLPLLRGISTVGSFFMADAQSVSMARVQIWSGPPGIPSLQERHKHRRDIRVQVRASPVVHRCCLTMCARSEHPRVEGETCDTLDRATAFQKAAEHGPRCGARFLLHGSAGCSPMRTSSQNHPRLRNNFAHSVLKRFINRDGSTCFCSQRKSA